MSIAKKLTRMNMLVSGTALLMACAAFIAYDPVSFREFILYDLSIQTQIIGSNSNSALWFDDPHSAATTLSALKAAPNIVSAGFTRPTAGRSQHIGATAKPESRSYRQSRRGGQRPIGRRAKMLFRPAREDFRPSRLASPISNQICGD